MTLPTLGMTKHEKKISSKSPHLTRCAPRRRRAKEAKAQGAAVPGDANKGAPCAHRLPSARLKHVHAHENDNKRQAGVAFDTMSQPTAAQHTTLLNRVLHRLARGWQCPVRRASMHGRGGWEARDRSNAVQQRCALPPSHGCSS